MPNRLLVFSIVSLGLLCGAVSMADDDTEALKIRARYEIEPMSRAGQIVVECELPEGHHIYSLQQSSPPGPTKIQVAKSDQFEMTGAFMADRPPEVIEHDPVFETRLEQFNEKVTFTIPFQLAKNVDPEKLTAALTINCQVCSENGCVLIRNKKFVATFGGFIEPRALRKNDPDANKINRPQGQDKEPSSNKNSVSSGTKTHG